MTSGMTPEQQLFAMALGLELPWQLERVEFEGATPEAVPELHLHLGMAPGAAVSCSSCGSVASVYDHPKARTWRHLNFFQFKAFLHASPPRTSCATCGVKKVEVPWARPGSGFTLLFEAMVLMMARRMAVAPLAVAPLAGLLQVSDKQAWRILEHYVEQAKEERDLSGVAQVGIDETSMKPGHNYITVAADLERAQVLFVTPGKDASTVTRFVQDLKEHKGNPERIEAICSDLSPAFISGIARELPRAHHVFDRFHVMKIVNTALDQVRRQEVKENQVLRQTRYLWLKNPASLQPHQDKQLEMLQTMNLATATAYQMKLNLRELWEQPDRQSAENVSWTSGASGPKKAKEVKP